MKNLLASTLVLLTAGLTSACTLESGSESDEAIAETHEALGETYFYFRSNATGWGADSATRFLPFAGAGVVARVYDVTQPWMVSRRRTQVPYDPDRLEGERVCRRLPGWLDLLAHGERHPDLRAVIAP
jgi:hypothetical protein